MRSEFESLTESVLDEADCLYDLIDAIREQRQAMRDRDEELVKNLMDEIRDIFFDAQTKESIRDDLAKKLAAKYSCEPKASSLEKFMNDYDKANFNGAADRLTQSIFILKSEMLILNGMIDQNERYTSMLLSEWQRLSGGRAQSGVNNSLDFRG